MRHDYRRLRIRQHKAEALRRMGGIQGEIGSSRLQDAEHPHDHVEGALDV